MNSSKIRQKVSFNKAISVGGENGPALIGALKEDHYRISARAKDLLEHPDLAVNSKLGKFILSDVHTSDVYPTPYALFFYEDVLKKVAAHPLINLCAPEDGPYLRLQYPEQKCFQPVVIGMAPICGSVFVVEYKGDGIHWLDAIRVTSRYLTEPRQIVFRLN